MRLGLLLLAAGQSTRFGPEDKLLAPLAGVPMVVQAARAFCGQNFALRLAVVSTEPVAAILRDEGFTIETVPPGEAQSASIAAGVAALRKYRVDRLVIALGDMPFLHPMDVSALLSLPADRPASAWSDGAPRPPAVFPSGWFDRLVRLKGDRGAGAYLRDLAPESRLELSPERLRDIDLRADLDG